MGRLGLSSFAPLFLHPTHRRTITMSSHDNTLSSHVHALSSPVLFQLLDAMENSDAVMVSLNGVRRAMLMAVILPEGLGVEERG